MRRTARAGAACVAAVAAILALASAGSAAAAPSAATPADSSRAPAPARAGAPAPALHDTLIIHRTPIPAERLPIADTTDVAAPAGPEARRYPPEGLTGFDQPKWVMARSLVLPGWGQLHNGSWKKAVLIGGVETALIATLVSDKLGVDRKLRDITADQLAGNDAQATADEADYNARSDRYIGHQWWLGAALAYSLLDAYIDAHFRNFHVGPNDDPALPPGERRSAGLRLSVQERF